jgi:hypothetical protein
MRLWEDVNVHQDLQDLQDLQDQQDSNYFKNSEEQLAKLDPQDLQEHLDQLD